MEKRLRVGVIGAGWVATARHIPCYQRLENVEVVAEIKSISTLTESRHLVNLLLLGEGESLGWEQTARRGGRFVAVITSSGGRFKSNFSFQYVS